MFETNEVKWRDTIDDDVKRWMRERLPIWIMSQLEVRVYKFEEQINISGATFSEDVSVMPRF